MTFLEFLEANKQKKVFVDPCSGNNGDLLIWKGMQEALHKVGVRLVESEADAELFVINGGGMFIDGYKQGVGKIDHYSNAYPDVPLCVAPNSFYFERVDFGRYLDMRMAPLTLFCREKYSKKYIDRLLEERPLVAAHLDHDLAFHLAGSKFIAEIQSQYRSPEKGAVLVVDRMDHERPGNSQKPSKIKKLYNFVVPKFIKDVIRTQRVKHRDNRGTAFTRGALELIKNNIPGFNFSKVKTADISRNDIFSFDDFIREVAVAEFVFTNRLHVGILAHLLGRTVYMMEGSYHKMTGIYEYSMSHQISTKLYLEK